ncbi:MAG: LapA family protein, partial [Rhizobiales bacterium]|nr:LapA family protein [Hyphomicrobiales bacterium]
GAHPAASLTLPLYALVIVLLVIGVLIGGIAAWLRQSKWRRTARRLEREIADLHIEIEALKRNGGVLATGVNVPAAPPERLQLRPPMR